MALLEEVFAQNKTLIEVLDQNGVTTIDFIRQDVHRIETEQVQQKSQLDSLARTVDTYQKSNEAQFVDFNTRINNLSTLVDNIAVEFVSRAEFDSNNYVQNRRFVALEEHVVKLQTEVNGIDQQITSINQTSEKQALEIATVDSEVKTLKSSVALLELDVIYRCYVYTETPYYLLPTDSQGLAVWTVRLLGPYGRNTKAQGQPLNFVSKYRFDANITYGGVTYSSISFIQTGQLSGNSHPGLRLVPTGYQMVNLWSTSSTARRSPVLIVKT
jgi:hypothetical protein